MSKTGMRIIMFVCAVVIGLTGRSIMQRLGAPDAAPPPPPPPLVSMDPPPLPTPVTTAQPARTSPPADKPTLSMARRAAMLLVGAWQLDDKATRSANGTLAKPDAARLNRALDGMRGTVTVYQEDGTMQLVKQDSGGALGTAQWRADEANDADVLVTFQHSDASQTQQRVLLPTYDSAATQSDEFVFVWNRHVAFPKAPPVPRRPVDSPSAQELFRVAPSAAGMAWDNRVAQARWETYRKQAEQIRMTQTTNTGCAHAGHCARICQATDGACLASCYQSIGCTNPNPLYVK